uniref:DUF4224 domain-containing protein n=1 Tax=Herbaspirillum sp. DW155 TaxID=3095609 RepID=UPI00403FA267
MIFLTNDELRELTGYAYCSHQILWLRNHNWKFEVSGQRRPKVARAYFELRMLGKDVQSRSLVVEDLKRPNFSAIGKMLRK